jgi:hypothetical protein
VASTQTSPSSQEAQHVMWEQYKKTFGRIQTAIALVSGAVFFGMGRQWFVTAIFFLMMQVGGVIGAAWAVRLKRKLQPQLW